MTADSVQEYSAGIIPLRKSSDGEWKIFLIRHRYGGHVGFPKGHVEEGETFQETAKRELQEETGLTVSSFCSLEPFEVAYSFSRKGDTYQKTVWYFAAIVDGNIVLQIEEVKEGRWYSLEEAIKEIHFDNNKAICQRLNFWIKENL